MRIRLCHPRHSLQYIEISLSPIRLEYATSSARLSADPCLRSRRDAAQRQRILTEATAAALRHAIASGVEVVFATGRRHSFAWTMLGPLGLDPETVLISSNGAITRTFGGRPSIALACRSRPRCSFAAS